MKTENNKKIGKPTRDPRHAKFRVLSTSLTIIVIVGIVLLNVIVGVLADSVAGRMRRHGLLCNTVQVTIRDPSFRSISRQKRL